MKVIGLILLFILFTQTAGMAEERTGKVVLYEGISGGKKLPFIPDTQITRERANSLLTYYEAVYDRDGKLIRLTKYLNNKIFTVQTISYEGDQVAGVTIKDSEGKIIRSVYRKNK